MNTDIPTSIKKDPSPKMNSAPEEKTKKGDDDTPQNDNNEHPECPWPEKPTFQDAKNYLVCDNVITERSIEAEYEYERPTYRKELL